jgi:hypothetical protein
MPAQRSQNGRPDFERDLLAQLAARWGRRAVIKQDELDLDGHGLHELQFDPHGWSVVRGLTLRGAGYSADFGVSDNASKCHGVTSYTATSEQTRGSQLSGPFTGDLSSR